MILSNKGRKKVDMFGLFYILSLHNLLFFLFHIIETLALFPPSFFNKIYRLHEIYYFTENEFYVDE